MKRVLWGLAALCAAALALAAIRANLPGEARRYKVVSAAPAPVAPAREDARWFNTASREELMQLRGVGGKLAGRIIALREKQPFFFLEDLTAVPGIGEKRLEQWREDIRRP